MGRIPGAVRRASAPGGQHASLQVNVDRSRAAEFGLTQRDVANSMLVSLSSSSVVSPNYWPIPQRHQLRRRGADPPEPRRLRHTLMNTAITPSAAGQSQLLSNLATLERREVPAVISHRTCSPSSTSTPTCRAADLGSVAAEVQKIVAEQRAKLPPGHRIAVRGQVESMNSAFVRLGLG